MIPQETKIELDFPITSNGILVREITLRRPKVKDSLAAQKAAPTEAEREVRLVANLSGLAPSEIEELDQADYQRIAEVLAGFLSPRPPSSAKR